MCIMAGTHLPVRMSLASCVFVLLCERRCASQFSKTVASVSRTAGGVATNWAWSVVSRLRVARDSACRRNVCFIGRTGLVMHCDVADDAENGHPSCANGYLLNDVLRGKFGQEHAFVTTDCGAVSNMLGPPANAASPEQACAWTINNGTDLEMGSTVWTEHMHAAYMGGLVNESTITRSSRRAFRQLMLAGRFDPPSVVGWSALGVDAINSSHSQQVAYEAALQGMVLLKNEGQLLPLKAGSNLAVVGPMAVNQDLMSDYAGGTGESGCWPHSDESCIVTIGGAIAQLNDASRQDGTPVLRGVDVNSQDGSGIAEAIAAAQEADVVVLVLGNDRTQEHEGIDRPDITLPGLQEQFALEILGLKKPTVLIMANGGPLAIDSLLPGCGAVVEAFNPAQSTPALAQLLFGRENRWGKLPYTIYPRAYATEQPMANFDMTVVPGRTYKYYRGTPLFAFGHGLSYATFIVMCGPPAGHPSNGGSASVTCTVNNQDDIAGDEVLLAYHTVGDAIKARVNHPVPIRALRAFERVRVPARGSVKVEFTFTQTDFLLVNNEGEKALYPGDHAIVVDNGAGSEATIDFHL
eukprot:m.1000808 g.1000808  ORF g.1000808 m.1000808 type:complete len:580 (-) comp24028_c0_seq12:1391-3130(-)